jgi:hypothetical protein
MEADQLLGDVLEGKKYARLDAQYLLSGIGSRDGAARFEADEEGARLTGAE